MNKTIDFLKDVIAEGKNVTWPKNKDTILYTVAVLIVSVGIAYFLGLFDSVFSKGLEYLLTK